MSAPDDTKPCTNTDYTDAIAVTAAQTAGELLALIPEPTCQIAGAALKGSAGLIAKVSSAVSTLILQRRHERVAEVLGEVAAKAADEGLTESVAAQGDVLTAAFAVAGDAETEEKRRMIAEVILNAAAPAEERIRSAEAQTALQLISTMSPQAALLFSIVAADWSTAGARRIPGDELLIPEAVALLALEEIGCLTWEDEDQNTVSENVGERRPVCEYRRLWAKGSFWIKLLPLGEWLAKWVVDNRDRAIVV